MSTIFIMNLVYSMVKLKVSLRRRKREERKCKEYERKDNKVDHYQRQTFNELKFVLQVI
jgi:hypothetical protein